MVLAGGGSGGHIAPGLAIAERLAQIEPNIRCVFACSERPIDLSMLDAAGAKSKPIPARPFSVRPAGLWSFVRSVLPARAACDALVKSEQPDWIVSLGGFVSAPVAAAARRAGARVLLVNLDAVAGRANRWISRRADVVVSAVPAKGLAVQPQSIVGVPLRRSTRPVSDQASSRAAFGLAPDAPTLFVTGASQGAASVNRFMAAFAASPDKPLRGWQVLHQCGPRGDDVGLLESAYRDAGVRAVVVPFVDRMGHAWGAADATLARAGANLVWEVRQACVPAVFSPYPWHKDLHQEANARELVDAGGAIIAYDRLEPALNMDSIGGPMREVLAHPARRKAMKHALESLPKIDAADRIAAWLVGRCGW